MTRITVTASSGTFCVVSLYATCLGGDEDPRVLRSFGDMSKVGRPVFKSDWLYLGGALAAHFEAAGRQCPRVLGYKECGPEVCVLSELRDGARDGARVDKRYSISTWKSWLVGIPYTGFVVALAGEADGDLDAAIQLLNDTYHRRSKIKRGEHSLLTAVVSDAEADSEAPLPDLVADLDAHQLLVLRDLDLLTEDSMGSEGDANPERLRRILFRGEPAREAFGTVYRPPSPNRPARTVVALRSSVSVVAGVERHLVTALQLATAQSVASIARSRRIRRHAYEALHTAQSWGQVDSNPAERDGLGLEEQRSELAQLARFLRTLESELSFGIRANSDVALILPVAEVTEYHRDLASILGTDSALDVTDHLLASLTRAISTARDATAAAERERDERLQDRVTLIGATLLVPGLVASFYGANISGFPGHDKASGVAWLLGFMFLFGAATLIVIRWSRRKRPDRRPSETSGPTIAPSPHLPPPARL